MSAETINNLHIKYYKEEPDGLQTPVGTLALVPEAEVTPYQPPASVGSTTRPIYLNANREFVAGTQIGNAGYRDITTDPNTFVGNNNLPTAGAVASYVASHSGGGKTRHRIYVYLSELGGFSSAMDVRLFLDFNSTRTTAYPCNDFNDLKTILSDGGYNKNNWSACDLNVVKMVASGTPTTYYIANALKWNATNSTFQFLGNASVFNEADGSGYKPKDFTTDYTSIYEYQDIVG